MGHSFITTELKQCLGGYTRMSVSVADIITGIQKASNFWMKQRAWETFNIGLLISSWLYTVLRLMFTISCLFNMCHLLLVSPEYKRSENYMYLEMCISKAGWGAGNQSNPVRQIWNQVNFILIFMLSLLPHTVSVSCQIKKMEQPVHTK